VFVHVEARKPYSVRLMSSVPAHVTHLRLAQPATIELARALPLLMEQAPAWLGAPAPGARDGYRRYLTDLSLPLREHSPNMTFSKAAFVDLGPVRSGPASHEVALEWRSSSLAPLFPVFSGSLLVTPSEVVLEGYYAPPAGDVGAVLDRAFLNIAARGTARWFLDRACHVLGSRTPRS
jgi:hypothetical protein